MIDPTLRIEIEKNLLLEPQERGYEVLLIVPYYKSLLSYERENKKGNMPVSPPLLTFLDLYHFPLRGQEQAIYMAERLEELKKIYGKI